MNIRLTRYTGNTLDEQIALNDTTNCIVEQFPMRSASPDTEYIDEQIRLVIRGTNAKQTLRNIEKAIQFAKRYTTQRSGSRVYLEYYDGAWWRSLIRDARMDLDSESADLVARSNVIQASLVISRENGWEYGDADIAVPISNANGTNVTTGLTVYPFDDSQTGKDNWIEITSAETIQGNIPARARIEITNTYNNAARTGVIRISHKWQSYVGNVTLEGEDALALNGTRTIYPETPDYSAYSNGKYAELTVSSSGSALYWDLGSSFLQLCNGSLFKPIVWMYSPQYNNLWAKVRLTYASLTTLYESNWQLINTSQKVHEVGTVRIPPYLYNVGTLDPLRFEIWFRRQGGGTVEIDCVQLFPADGYQRIEHRGYDLPYQSTLIVDGINRMTYVSAQGSILGYQTVFGSSILLMPDIAQQRLYISASGNNPGLRTSSVKLYYRPRRLTL